MRERLNIRIDAELRQWLTATAERESRTMTHIVERALCNERHAAGPAPIVPRPARDVTTPEPVATAREQMIADLEKPLTKQELDAARQAKLNANRKGSR